MGRDGSSYGLMLPHLPALMRSAWLQCFPVYQTNSTGSLLTDRIDIGSNAISGVALHPRNLEVAAKFTSYKSSLETFENKLPKTRNNLRPSAKRAIDIAEKLRYF